MPVLRPHLSGIVIFCLFIATFSGIGRAQAAAAASGSSSLAAIGTANTPAPPINGFNFSLNNNAQHSSVTGWSDIVTPDLSYRFNSHFYVDANVPWYLTVQNFVQTKAAGVTTYPLKETKNVIGDTSASGHFGMSADDFSYSASATVGLPTGDSKYGLTANTMTYNLNNHFEY